MDVFRIVFNVLINPHLQSKFRYQVLIWTQNQNSTVHLEYLKLPIGSITVIVLFPPSHYCAINLHKKSSDNIVLKSSFVAWISITNSQKLQFHRFNLHQKLKTNKKLFSFGSSAAKRTFVVLLKAHLMTQLKKKNDKIRKWRARKIFQEELLTMWSSCIRQYEGEKENEKV